MTPLAFAKSLVGRTVQSPGGLGGQCVDLANIYLIRVLGRRPVNRNAVDWANSPIPGLVFTQNTPTNTPTPGSLVVWGQFDKESIGMNGHIALALAADDLTLLSCDQNWPDGSPVSLVFHDYGGVLGWLTP